MMKDHHLLLLRHGETDANAAGIIQGQSQVPLNDTGIAQATRLAQRLTTYHPRVELIVTSDLRRAMQTAELIAKETGAPIVADPAWRERGLGIMEGRSFADLLSWRSQTGEDTPPQGETRAAMEARVVYAVTNLFDRFGQCSAIAVVTHGGAIQIILNQLAAGVLPMAVGHEPVELCDVLNCSILHLILSDGRWSVRCVNDAAHLSDMPPPRGRPNPDAPPLSRSSQV